MRKLFPFLFLSFISLISFANPILVKNIDELNAANKKAKPGDIILLQNGAWHNVSIKLTSKGTSEAPVIYKAQNNGRVIISGNSELRIGGEYIIVEGLLFTNGYAGSNPVITFRTGKDQIANNCRVTNCVIDDFNNPKRMDENYWIAFYGKNNRLDHCSFQGKKNMGVLLAVILDDDRSRENFHSIDHNYFGRRVPLGSNGGEIIRVGVSQHCQFNSNTQIIENYFEYCDGETEIVSIKSGNNVVKKNTFKECQGSVVLRHGDYNTVSDNIFIGNDKAGTGGVRVINKGQKVLNNIFYKCRGVDFRSPLAIMNGIPNSPANRYVQVTDAIIKENTFYESAPITFGEGSDTERTLPPAGVLFERNNFYNIKDSIIYKVYDDLKGIRFTSNSVSKNLPQRLLNGFEKKLSPASLVPENVKNAIAASEKSKENMGSTWFKTLPDNLSKKKTTVNCSTPEQIYQQLSKREASIIALTADIYKLSKPFIIESFVQFVGKPGKNILFETENLQSVFIIGSNGNLELSKLVVDGSKTKALNFISNDSTGSSGHYNLVIKDCTIKNFNSETGCKNIFYAYKYMIADSIIIRNNSFSKNIANTILMNNETDNKGYYSAEKIVIGHNNFSKQVGTLLSVYRGGNDESTMGPNISISHNKFDKCISTDNNPLIQFTGVQVSAVFANNFSKSNKDNILIAYKDFVRANHLIAKNILESSGEIESNKYVKEKENIIK